MEVPPASLPSAGRGGGKHGKTRTKLLTRISTATRSKRWRAHELPGAEQACVPAFIMHLVEHGWAVVDNVLTAAECAAVQAAALAFAPVPVPIPAVTAGSGSTTGPGPTHAWQQGPGASALQSLWDVRQNPRVIDAFAQMWGTRDLVVSTEGFYAETPTPADGSKGTGELPALYADLGVAGGTFTPPQISIATGRLAAGEVCVRGFVTAAPLERWCVLDGSHKYVAACMAVFGVNTGHVDHAVLSDEQVAWLQEHVGSEKAAAEDKDEDDDDDSSDEELPATVKARLVWRPRSTRTLVKVPAGSCVLHLAHTVCGLAPSSHSEPTCLVPLCYAPRTWAETADLRRKRILFAKGATTDEWPLFHTRVLSLPPPPVVWPHLTALGARLVGFDAIPPAAELQSLATAVLPDAPSTTPTVHRVVAPAAPYDPFGTPARRPARPLTVTSPGRAGLILTMKRTLTIGDRATLQLVREAIREGDTVLTVMQPDVLAGAYTPHSVLATVAGGAAREALAATVNLGWLADMMVADTEGIALGRNAMGQRVLERDDKGHLHHIIPLALPTAAPATAAALVRRQLVELPGLGPPRRLVVRGYANDSVVVEAAPWEMAAITAELAPLRPQLKAVDVEVCVVEVEVGLMLWAATDVVVPPTATREQREAARAAAEATAKPPPAAAALLTIKHFLAASPQWGAAVPHVRLTLGTVGAERRALEGWADGASVLVICEGCMNFVYDMLEGELTALFPPAAGVLVRVAWDGKAAKTSTGLPATVRSIRV